MGKIKKYSEFGNCKICNDSATGIHYNVASCEGCKGFFKRSVLLSKKYECYYGYTCIISVENRIRCKGCRFKSCIENGMSTEFLCGGERKRKRRIGVKKYDDRLKKIALAHIANEEKSKNKILEKIYEEPITNVIDAKHVVHGESNDQTEFFNLEECLDFLQEPIFPDASDFSILAESSNLLEENFQPNFSEAVNLEEESLESIKSGLVNGIDYLFESLINFLKEIPGFYIQNFSDYSFLINNRLFDYFLVGKLRFFKQPFKLVSFKIKYSHLVQNDQSFILLPNNIQFSKFWMQRTFGNEMVEAIFDFARKFNSLGLSPHEISLLIPAALTIYDESFQDPIKIANLHDYHAEKFFEHVSLSGRHENFYSMLDHLFTLLPLLNQLHLKHIGPMFTLKYQVPEPVELQGYFEPLQDHLNSIHLHFL